MGIFPQTLNILQLPLCYSTFIVEAFRPCDLVTRLHKAHAWHAV